MFAFSFPFSIGFKPATGDAPRIVSDWALSSEHSLLMHVRRGDTLRVERGTVWLGADRSSTLLELNAGAEHTAPRDAVLHMTGVDGPRVTLLSHAPVKASTRADYGNWRHKPPLMGTRQADGP